MIFGVLILVAVFATFYCASDVEAADSEGVPVMVSMGDSYSSGEGIEPFYNQDDEHKENSQNWIAHRSQKCWAGRLSLKDANGNRMKMSDYYGKNWYFVADSGAETWHINNSYEKDWSFNIFNSGKTKIDAQLDVFDKIAAEGKTADFVTLTIGGNDAGFSKIIEDAATSFTYTTIISPSHLSDRLDNTWHDFYKEGGIRDNIRNTYYDIANKAGGDTVILIAGYPKLLSEESTDVLFDGKEAVMINNAVHSFNEELKSLADDCREPKDSQINPIRTFFVSVEEGFEGHAAYSRDSYINEVITGSQPQELIWNAVVSSYSIHPNDKGAKAYADCVQKKIDELFEGSEAKSGEMDTEENESQEIIDFDLIGDWSTSDGMTLTFNDNGTYDLDWDFGVSETGNYSLGEMDGSSFEITMDGSSILSMMQLVYGGSNSNYHFEILVKDDDNMSLVQVYGDYTAETSPCKLPFSRQ